MELGSREPLQNPCFQSLAARNPLIGMRAILEKLSFLKIALI